MYRLVLGISGASGMPLAQAVLENLATVSDLEVHLIILSLIHISEPTRP